MHWIKFLCIVLFAVFCMAQASADPVLTEAQATAIAVNFCQQIGAPLPANVHSTANYYLPGVEFISESYYLPIWHIVFTDDDGQELAKVNVVDQTSVIAEYTSWIPDNILGDRPAGAAISESTALSIAAIVVAATGEQSNIAYDHNYVALHGIDASMHKYYIAYRRQFHGYTYDEEGPSVGLNAETGGVTSYAACLFSPPLTSFPNNVTRAQADAVVAATIAQKGLQNAILSSFGTLIVQPNTYWMPAGTPDPPENQAKVVFSYDILADDVDYGTVSYLMWIDKGTGKIVGGGARIAIADMPAPPQKPVHKGLKQADAIRVYKMGKWGASKFIARGKDELLATLSPHSLPKMFFLLKKSKPTRTPGPLAMATHRLVYLKKGKPICTIYYLLKNGRFGERGEWRQAAPAFQKWVAKQETGNPERLSAVRRSK